MPIQTLNPYTNKVEKTFEEFSSEQIETIIAKADEAHKSWKNTSVAKRCELMHNLAKVLREKADHWAKFPVIEMGKLFRESKDWEIDICAQIATYYAKNGKKFLAPEVLKRNLFTGSTVVEKHSIGVLFGIMPWNYPYYQIFRFAVPNIIAGNTIILKHASNVPQCAIAVEEMFKEAGFPEGVYTNVLVSGRNTAQIIEDPRVKGISLTGSETAGAKVAELAGKHLKKVVMELGGSDPFVMLDDADMDYSVEVGLLGRFFNSGQTCIASKRFVIHEKVYDEYLAKFKGALQMYVPGDPMEYKTMYAPMSSMDELEYLDGLVQKAIEQGAVLEAGGKRIEGLPGAWYEPTILSNVTKDMDIYSQELFGPVAVFYKAKNDADAVALANDSQYGLSSVVMSKNNSRANNVASQLEAGMTFINCPSITEPETPFGGVKNSGYGRELAKMGIEEFVNLKTVRKIPVWAFKMLLNKQKKALASS
ncbi:succinate-semialdehyde dehydrogenase [Tenacibaculum holothuriorum]|uniref:Succinate-semialdehyde dehydrogenase n=1 Tax=Tenacibaculum holothuriorum TaxID=1635173 RepID=A0A1Y2PAE7_9FLAO|nr:NAD-dependent succinate-semialdehyde dehydrogenase [Tenacibaculum holothuriorum]OSY87402.1 succinate-semialdehyde dehydrogenase [Tenacibaculum holothuriorum]